MRLGSYEEWQLGRPSTPRSVLAELVRQATGHEMDSLDRILEGYSNEVYRAGCASGDDVVIRILRFDDDVSMARSAEEAWAIEKARSAGVPAGEVLLLAGVHVDGTDFPVMVQRAVPGRPLGEVIGELSIEQRRDVLTEVGRLIARLGAITLDCPYDWRAATTASLAAQRAAQDGILDAGFTRTEVRAMFGLLEAYVRDFPWLQMVLCHGDLSAKHIFVTGESAAGAHVSGFIDFGDWTPGAPVHDLAVLRVRSPELDFAPILAGHGRAGVGSFRRQVDLDTLLVALDALAFQVAELDQAGAAVTTDLIHALVGDLTGENC